MVTNFIKAKQHKRHTEKQKEKTIQKEKLSSREFPTVSFLNRVLTC